MRKVILIILDGWGIAPAWGGNAVESAETFNFDQYWRKYPHTTLRAAEEAVGLPRHEPGNSEVGHLNIGCGQIVKQNLPGITATIGDGSFFKNPALLAAIQKAKDKNSNLHLIGLVSDGGVHSHTSQLFALLDLIKKENFSRVYIHMITDGRDTDQMKALSYLSALEEKLKEIGIGRVESVMGRFYAMDRDNRWDRIKAAYDVLTLGVGHKSESPEKAISESYRQGQYDEFIIPTIIESDKEKFVPIKDSDSIIFFNFRADRTKELTWSFVQKHFRNFDRQKFLQDIFFATFAFHEEYEEQLPVQVVFRKTSILNPLAKIIADKGLKQFHIAETEKYAHVTYFFNGGHGEPFAGEDRVLVPSPKVATYDLKPEMSAEKITNEVLKKHNNYDFTIVNFANPDMVGHTGNNRATVRACEFVDLCLGKIIKDALPTKTIIITADHGNAEQMINPNTGEPHTEHTTNLVPFILLSADPNLQNPLKQNTNGNYLVLSDIAPTILKIMDLPLSNEMTGKNLIE
ncbi:MAG: 2,3-bisphosphoglycerate-independent phosphoglycerate mutase [Patescibacteria group bacterium]